MDEQKKKVSASNVPDRFPIRKSELDRFKFGKLKYVEMSLDREAPNCLDVACGAKPFPKANVLCDLYSEPVADRNMEKLETGGKPFVLCNCYFLPFKTKAFHFATSYYLMEHLTEPWSFFKELKRVSEHGYVQSPSWFNELLYGEDVHRWIIMKRGKKLCVKPLSKGAKASLRFGFIFHRLYRHTTWQIIHAILDETFNLFTVCYDF